jgi:hypothetical protein
MRQKIATKVMILKEGSMMSTGTAKPRLNSKLTSTDAKISRANADIVFTCKSNNNNDLIV